MMITIKNDQQTVPVNLDQMRTDAEKLLEALDYPDYELNIWLVTNNAMQEYNKKYRDKDNPTDILSFPFWPNLKPGQTITPAYDDEKILGDIIIAPQYVSDDLEQWGQSFDDRMRTLLVHGLCHLLGYDHIKDEEYAIMDKKEQELLTMLRA